MKNLIDNLLLFDRLNEQQIRLVNHLTQEVHLKEGEYLAEPGYTCCQLSLVQSGVLRYNFYNRKAENITSCLIGEGNFIAGVGPLHLPVIQSDYLQAITSCALLVITKSGMDELSSALSNWDGILRKVSQKAIAETRSRILRRSGNTDPEVTAAQYLARFPNIGKHINVDQMLRYFGAQPNDHKVG
jgi:CRP-like cAMP-binding protein